MNSKVKKAILENTRLAGLATGSCPDCGKEMFEAKGLGMIHVSGVEEWNCKQAQSGSNAMKLWKGRKEENANSL